MNSSGRYVEEETIDKRRGGILVECHKKKNKKKQQ